MLKEPVDAIRKMRTVIEVLKLVGLQVTAYGAVCPAVDIDGCLEHGLKEVPFFHGGKDGYPSHFFAALVVGGNELLHAIKIYDSRVLEAPGSK